MSDHEAIVRTIEQVLHGADRRDWNAICEVLAPVIELDYGTPEQLAATAVVDRWRLLFDALDRTEHHLVAPDVVVTGDRASVQSRFTAHHELGDAYWDLDGSYAFELVRDGAGWRVVRMRMVPARSTGNDGLPALALARARGVDAARARNRATVEAFFARLEAFDIPGFVALFAADARQLMPYAPPGFPRRLDGRDAIQAQYAGIADAFTSMRFVDRELLATTDPTRFVVAFRGAIELRAGGRYDNTYVSLFTVADGRIVEIVEHFDPLVLQAAFGGDARAAAHAPD